MNESETELGPSYVDDLLKSVGYVGVDQTQTQTHSSHSLKLFAALSWCISSAFSRKIEAVEDIEDALKMTGCPYDVQTSQIENCDYAGIYPAIQWLISVVKTAQHDNNFMNEKKVSILNELQLLNEKVNEAGIGGVAKELASLLKISKALERQACDIQSEYEKHSGLLTDITKLEENLSEGTDDQYLNDYIDNLCCDLSKKLTFAKRELASKMKESVSLKRRLDFPNHEEVFQYEQRFSELNAHIQDRLHRTRNYYATYNAFQEMKDLMLKEISLLNSLDSQFQDAIESPAGELVYSMEAILKGTRQKLEKVQPGLQVEYEALGRFRDQYSIAIATQRHLSALSKAFQEECNKNERLKEECAKIAGFNMECQKSEGHGHAFS